ncbi:unnamed protein product [Leptidea sinapis]|uniref:V-type proton ATPase subunit a n=1 Tax=Leptidea sinapis TaxID=189913 RepID=A0A5E4Q8U4_9NEOP|nr:unnamed protein product [Leptidea sinapis]
MFGDLGHGALMAVFGFWMCYKEKPLQAKKIDSEIWNIFFGGRYIILLMGLFSMYTGLIYNDIFSKSLNIFGSSWRNNYNVSTLQENKLLQLNPDSMDYIQKPYPFGIDPVWQLAEANKIIFMNAYKMKISIIIGVFHMLFGVSLSLWNHIYYKRRINIYVEFIPQIMFLTLLFFYMVLLMFIKWTSYGSTPPFFGSQDPEIVKSSAFCAPSILITFINMMLFKKDENSRPQCDETMYAGQMGLQKLFVLLALCCVPVMLSPAAVGRRGGERHCWRSVCPTRPPTCGCGHCLMSGGYQGGIFLYVVFAGWAAISVSILVLMEGLSAFLHTLRLHWVEFQSKFYAGEGYLFQPFSFEVILDTASQTDE